MLLVVGTLLGKDYGVDGGLAKADEIIEKLKLKSFFSGKQSFEIKLGKSLRIVSPAHDNLEMVGSHTESTMFSAVHDGNQFTIRYYEAVGSIPRKTGAEKRYTPRRIGLSASTFLNKDTAKEKCLFLLLHPNCEQSPFKTRGGKTMWSVVDRQADSKKQLEVEKLNGQVTALVWGADDDTLRRKAHGIKIHDKLNTESKGVYLQVRDATNSDKDSIRLDLFKIAKKYPQEFLEQWNDSGNDIFGVLQGAVSSGIIESKPTSMGNTTWKWRAGINDGMEITTVPKLSDPMTGLVAWCAENDFPEISRIISRASGTGLSEERLSAVMAETFGKKPADMTVEELVLFASSRKQANAIYFDAFGKKIFLVDANTDPVGEALLTVKDKALWQNELTELLNKDKNALNRVRKHLG